MDIKVDQHTVVVFDLDDTLYNELDYLKSSFKKISQHISPDNWKSLYAFMFSLHRNKKDVFKIISENYSIDKQILIDWYRSHTPEIQLFDGALDLLNQIKQKGGKLAIITDGRVKTQTTTIESLRIAHFFDEIVISEALGTEKPHAANFQVVEKQLIGTHYYYIADNFKKDFLTPNALGWTTIGIIDNGLNVHYNHYEFFDKKHLPQNLILSFKEIQVI